MPPSRATTPAPAAVSTPVTRVQTRRRTPARIPRRPRAGVSLAQHAPPRHGMRARVQVTRQWGKTVETYTMGQIARRSGLDTSTVCRIFTGQRIGKVQTLEQIASALDVSLDILFSHLDAQRTRTR